MQSGNKLEKFIERLSRLISALGEQRNSMQIQNRINQFYYMQKVAELKLLEESVKEAEKRLRFFEDKFEAEYHQVFCRWRKDVRWMNKDSRFKVQDSKFQVPGSPAREVTDNSEMRVPDSSGS